MNSQKPNDPLRPEQQLIDHLLKDIEQLKESKKLLNENYQKELQKSKNFEIKAIQLSGNCSELENKVQNFEKKIYDGEEKRLEMSEKLEEEQGKSKRCEMNIFELERRYRDVYEKFEQENEKNSFLNKILQSFLKELEGKNVEKEIKQFLTEISFH